MSARMAELAPRLFDEADGRALAEASLRAITLSTARVRGDDFFRQLVKDLAATLDVFYVIVGEVCVVDGVESIKTHAVWAGQDFIPNITYGLACTPCRNVADQSMCFHACNIQQDYPEDLLLVNMKAESYIGMPMVGTSGKTLGILVALDVRPMDENKRLLALSLLSIFSARCAAEMEHRQREAELESLVEQRTRALEMAQNKLVEREKLAALGGLVAGMAHEINTPVGVAITAASGLEDYAKELIAATQGERISRSRLQELSEVVLTGAQLVERNLKRAAELVGNFKKLAVDQSSDDIAELTLRDYLNSLVVAHQPELRKHKAHLEIDIDPSIPVRMPAGMLGQMVSNLLMNALLHAFDGRDAGQIVLRAGVSGKRLELAVVDDGNGVTEDVRAHMLEPFYTTKRARGGTGLGLHIVYTLVQRLGGSIDITSSPGAGLTVTLSIPDCVI